MNYSKSWFLFNIYFEVGTFIINKEIVLGNKLNIIEVNELLDIIYWFKFKFLIFPWEVGIIPIV